MCLVQVVVLGIVNLFLTGIGIDLEMSVCIKSSVCLIEKRSQLPVELICAYMVFPAQFKGNAKIGLGIKVRIGPGIARRKIFLKKAWVFLGRGKRNIIKKWLKLFAVNNLREKIESEFFMIKYIGRKCQTAPAPPAKKIE